MLNYNHEYQDLEKNFSVATSENHTPNTHTRKICINNSFLLLFFHSYQRHTHDKPQIETDSNDHPDSIDSHCTEHTGKQPKHSKKLTNHVSNDNTGNSLVNWNTFNREPD